MTPGSLDDLLAPNDEDWRPSWVFMAELDERLDAVDAQLSREREQIPSIGARSESSVLFSLSALDERPAPDDSVDDAEPSGLLATGRDGDRSAHVGWPLPPFITTSGLIIVAAALFFWVATLVIR